MNPQQQELIAKIKEATNILVTVSANPTVDQLSACIGLTLVLNKLKKHATAVFSGEVPSTIEFLQPEDTLEKTTDSLRDFIISLDKSKADKLRYKVEDDVVRIFISPYRTSITDQDLEFSQGDFNVDVVVCLGVNQQADLDQAIVAHGRILHDATVVSINLQPGGELGAVNWTEPAASSLSELIAEMTPGLGEGLLDGQIATSLLTGIVSETARFSNDKTSPETMRLSAELMAAGANQQLVANELDVKPGSETFTAITAPKTFDKDDAIAHDEAEPVTVDTVDPDTGTLEIAHTSNDDEPEAPEVAADTPVAVDEPLTEPAITTGQDDTTGTNESPADNDITDNLSAPAPANSDPEPAASTETEASATPATEAEAPPASRIMLQPPSLGGTLTANSEPHDRSLQDPLTSNDDDHSTPVLDHVAATPTEPTVADLPPVAEPAPQLPAADEPVIQMPPVQPIISLPPDTAGTYQTLADLEAATATPPPSEPIVVDSTPQDLEAARDAVMDAINATPTNGPLPPTAASGANGYLNVQDLPGVVAAEPDLTEAAASQPLASQPLPSPPPVISPPVPAEPAAATPPPVPPPLPLNFTANNQ